LCAGYHTHTDMTKTVSDVTKAFLAYSRWKMIDEQWPRMRGCVESLTDDQVWWRPNEASNSAGNLLLHLNGNIGQWLIAAFRGSDDRRNRPAEFRQRETVAKQVLLDTLGATLSDASIVLASLTDADLLATMTIQGHKTTGLEAVYQVVDHFGMHYGQILYITKQLQGSDLGFYRELDATGRRA